MAGDITPADRQYRDVLDICSRLHDIGDRLVLLLLTADSLDEMSPPIAAADTAPGHSDTLASKPKVPAKAAPVSALAAS